MTEPTPETTLAVLAANVQAQQEQLARLGEELSLLRVELASTSDVAQPPAGAWCWRYATPERQEQLAEELGEWITWLRDRYPLTEKLPACWAEHPELVEELTALYAAWRSSYVEPGAPPNAPADWHDRWLPGVLSRIRGWGLARCLDGQHEARRAASSRP